MAVSDLAPTRETAIVNVWETTGWALGHVQQVQRLVTILFDELRQFHGYGQEEKILLESAALLHDVGYPVDASRHHKVSARIIRAHLGPPFTTEQIGMIALLARYHRKSPPKLRHRAYSQLDTHERRLVNWLGGILRVADGLDRAHDSAVHTVSASMVYQRLDIRISRRESQRAQANGQSLSRAASALVDLAQPVAADDLAEPIRGAMRKRDLLERALGVPVIVRSG